jgi:hypothetical protein
MIKNRAAPKAMFVGGSWRKRAAIQTRQSASRCKILSHHAVTASWCADTPLCGIAGAWADAVAKERQAESLTYFGRNSQDRGWLSAMRRPSLRRRASISVTQ